MFNDWTGAFKAEHSFSLPPHEGSILSRRCGSTDFLARPTWTQSCMHCHTDGPLSFGIARVGFFTRESWVTILAKCTVNVQVRKVGQGRSEDPKTKSDQIKLQTMLTAAESSCAPHQLKDLVSFGVSKVLYFVREKSHMKLRIYGSETLEQNFGSSLPILE